jgi:translation initiation factor IF-2
MSTVSAGLAETIREWFSGSEHKTSVETAAPVDLTKVKRRRPSRRKKKTEQADQETETAEPAETATTVAEPSEETETPTAPEKPAEETQPAEPVTAEETPAPAETASVQEKEEFVQEPPQPAETASAETTEEAPQPPAEKTGEGLVAEPPQEPAAGKEEAPAEPAKEKPETLQPAAKAPPETGKQKKEKKKDKKPPVGPQNVPSPAQMQGPKVVGFAKPEPVQNRGPRSRPRSRPTGPSPMEQVDLEVGRSARKKGKGKGKDRKRSQHRANPRRSERSRSEVGDRVREWNDQDLLERKRRLEEAGGRGIHARRAVEKKTSGQQPHVAPRKTKAQVTEPIVVHELCSATGIGMLQLMPKLRKEHNMMINRNTVIPADLAQLVMIDYGVELEVIKPKSESDKLAEEFAEYKRDNVQPRPPVVTMLGHVDHGKTSLLDAIRKTQVATGEEGGITQHIGAYQVEVEGLSVTFLDTPGHEAFTSMRARGANATDVVVLVVAADDGLMPQTIEAINHAKAAKVPIVVALNKIDLPGVDLNKIYGQLAEMELAPTEWGGETDIVKTSATTGQGIEEMITHLATLAELMDLKSDATMPGTGIVIEAQMETGMGPLARVLVKEGTLRQGDFLVCGPGAGRVRTMMDDRGRRVKEATPGMPVEVAGLDEVPSAGDAFYAVDSLQRAKNIAEETKELRRTETLGQMHKPQTLEDLLKGRETGEIPELNVILKADVQGSVDACVKSLSDIPSEEVRLSFMHTGVGVITESDVVLAEASDALIVGFNVAADAKAQKEAEAKGVEIRMYRVIYNLIDDIRKALEGLLPRDKSEEVRGKAEVREIFNLTRIGVVAGCLVTEGNIGRNHYAKVIRDGQIIVPTEDDVKKGRHRDIVSLKRFKDDVREVRSGMECGIKVENFSDVKPGDIIEAYEVIETARTL